MFDHHATDDTVLNTDNSNAMETRTKGIQTHLSHRSMATVVPDAWEPPTAENTSATLVSGAFLCTVELWPCTRTPPPKL
jgi:hypothetical protein